MNSGVSCALCGALLRDFQTRRQEGIVCVIHPRIIGHSYLGPAAWITTEYIVSKGTASTFDVVNPNLGIWDNATMEMRALDSTYKIGRAAEKQCQDAGTTCKPCYLMHNECWDLFKIVAVKLGVEELELPLYQCYLYKAFNAAAYHGGHLIWPHGYHIRPEAMLAYRQCLSLSHYGYFDPSGIDQVGYSELQLIGPRYSYQDHAYKKIADDEKDINIPDFLPLPLELTHKVLSFLPGTDIITLSGIKSVKTLQVPDFVWRSQFKLGAELGFVIEPRARFMKNLAETTWRAKYMFTKRILDENSRSASNLKRRWTIFTSLVHKLRETENSDIAELYDLEYENSIGRLSRNVDQVQNLFCASLIQKQTDLNGVVLSDGVKVNTSGKLGPFRTTGMFISYIGEGKLRFVSGFRFIPGGERLGLLNNEDEEYVQLSSAASVTQVMWLATSKYGIRSVLVVPAGIDCTFSNFDDVYVNRKMLKMKPEGIEITKFNITVGNSEVTSLCIQSPDFIETEVLDRQEGFIQRYSWSPSVPPVLSKDKIEIEHDSFCGYLEYAPKRARFSTTYLEHIVFAKQNVVRFTCWLTGGLDICGIGVYVKERDAPFILGTRTEFSTDAILEENEVITALNLSTGGKDCLPIGLTVCTDRGIVFRFTIPGLSHVPQKLILDAGKSKRIVGLFAGFQNSPQKTTSPRLLALGTIISNLNPRSPFSVGSQPVARNCPSNPQLHLWDEETDGICPKDVLLNSHNHLGYFISTAPLASCKSLEAYIQDNHHGFRLTGLCVNYGKEADAPQRSPAVLGRLSSTATKTTFQVHSEQGEYIAAADVYIRKVASFISSGLSLGVVGIVFWTSSRRKISCGKCHAEYANKIIPLRISIEEELILKWIYAENLDYLINVKDI